MGATGIDYYGMAAATEVIKGPHIGGVSGIVIMATAVETPMRRGRGKGLSWMKPMLLERRDPSTGTNTDGRPETGTATGHWALEFLSPRVPEFRPTGIRI